MCITTHKMNMYGIESDKIYREMKSQLRFIMNEWFHLNI